MFGQKIPSFNLKGKDTVYTLWGAVISLLVCTVMAMFAAMKTIHMLQRYNPNVT